MKTDQEFAVDMGALDTFAEDMKDRMRESRHKGGWSKLEFDQLFGMLTRKVLEVHLETDAIELIYLCADVANFAFMIADNEAARIRSQ